LQTPSLLLGSQSYGITLSQDCSDSVASYPCWHLEMAPARRNISNSACAQPLSYGRMNINGITSIWKVRSSYSTTWFISSPHIRQGASNRHKPGSNDDRAVQYSNISGLISHNISQYYWHSGMFQVRYGCLPFSTRYSRMVFSS
jgi:hypothetical protein